MTTLCRFCLPEDGPNEATTTIVVGYNKVLPACDNCKAEYDELAYADYMAEQNYEDMNDPAFNNHPAAMGNWS